MLSKVYVDSSGKCRCKTCESELTSRNVYTEFHKADEFEKDEDMGLFPDGYFYLAVVCSVCNYELFNFLPLEGMQEMPLVEEEELCQEQS